jgi:DegV family protein with EDD domain
MTIRIVTDSTCDIPGDVARELGITIIPDFINVGSESFLDGVDINRQDFYRRLPGWRASPSTSAPGAEVFQQVYERLAGEGATQVLSLHLSERLSNLSNVARLAAAATHSVAVTISPGGFITLGGGFAAVAGAQAARAGKNLQEVIDVINNCLERTYIYANAQTLEYLRRSGRVSNLRAMMGSWLKIIPVVKLHKDEVLIEPVRTQARAVARVIELAAGQAPLEHLGVLHANTPAAARDLFQSVAHLVPPGSAVWTMDITPVLGAHIGPGATGLVVMRAKEK